MRCIADEAEAAEVPRNEALFCCQALNPPDNMLDPSNVDGLARHASLAR